MFEPRLEPCHMDELLQNIEALGAVLSALTPESMTPDRIDDTVASLSALDLIRSIERYRLGMPVRPEDEEAAEAYDASMRESADAINKAVSAANQELTRLKEWRGMLDLEALDGVIALARGHVRALYDLTSSFQGD